jgi:type IV pilus assembly protein PilW
VNPVNSDNQNGFSLVELMVSLVIGLLVVASVLGVWLSTQRSYAFEEDMGRIQESGRFVVDTLTYDMRMAGFAGCSEELGDIVSHLTGVAGGDLQDTGARIEGRERGGATWQSTDTDWLPGNGSVIDDAAIRPGTDALTLRFFSARRVRLTTSMSGATDALSVASAPDYAQGQLVGITDCGGGDLFAVASATGDSGTTVTHGQTLSKLYYGDATKALSYVHPYTPVRYFIGTNAAGNAALMRQALDSDGTVLTQELLEGVENLQILYGEDTTGDEMADTYVAAAAVGQWELVRSVRFAVLVASAEESGTDTDANSYPMLDETIPAANDRRRRRVFTATVQLRNNR